MTDDARLTLVVLLDARARGADILNRRAVTEIALLPDGYRVMLEERGVKRSINTRFIVNASGPWVAAVEGLTDIAPPTRPLRLVRGSHIVLNAPKPPQPDAYTLQDEEERVIFVIPWLERRFLIIGTTDVPHHGDPDDARCSEEELDYLLTAYNRYFALPDGPATREDVVFTWSGVRALEDDLSARPSRISRNPALSFVANGAGGFITLYGGKLTTHRAFAETVLETLRTLGAPIGASWTKDAALQGSASQAELLTIAEQGPSGVPLATRRRWAFSYGDQIEALFARLCADSSSSEEIAPGVTRAELAYAVEVEDAMTAEDFLLRRTKLHLLLDRSGRDAVAAWFCANSA